MEFFLFYNKYLVIYDLRSEIRANVKFQKEMLDNPILLNYYIKRFLIR